MSLAVQFIRQGDWSDKTKLKDVQDTPTLLKTLETLWSKVPRR